MRPWDTNHPAYRDVFNAALTGVLSNPLFFGSVMQGDPKAAVEFADRIVLASTQAADAKATGGA